jgi:hypothetical protein
VCETYRYEVFRAPAQPDCSGEKQATQGRLLQQIVACGDDFVTLWKHPPAAKTDTLDGRQQWNRYCGQLKKALYAHFTRSGTAHCDQLTSLCQIACPDPKLDPTAFQTAITQDLQAFLPIVLAALQDCVCLALLPPCPESQQDPRVPLAVITVSGVQDCNIVDICNWTPLRKIVGTFPNLAYWLSAFNLLDTLRQELFCFCCEPLTAVQGKIFDIAARAEPLPVGANLGAPGGPPAPASALPLGGGIAGLVGKWLGDKKADVLDVLTTLKVTPDPAEIDTINQRVVALEAELSKLRSDLQSGHS